MVQQLSKGRQDEIENAAVTILEGYKGNNEESIDVVSIAKELGFIVGEAILDENDDGFIIVEEGQQEILGLKTDKLIGVNAKRELEWKRFIIAHELGHFVLHYLSQNNKGLYAHRDHRKGKGKIENEADFFAANLLMPSGSFRKRYYELKDKGLSQKEIAAVLASNFVVTIKCAERRVDELRLLNE